MGTANDFNGLVYPTASETCDSIDEDCDGVADNNPINPLTWYLDGDQDLRGDPSSFVMACTQPFGYVSNSNDCNDNEPLAWSSAPETCDQVDNDCDGATDENVTNTYYNDGDGDGYGDVHTSTEACTVPSGYVGNSNECNDQCGTCYPGATESCDGVDNNCDGATDEVNASDCVDYYQDLDGDGWGNSNSLCQCGPVGNYDTTQTGDCYDSGVNASLAILTKRPFKPVHEEMARGIMTAMVLSLSSCLVLKAVPKTGRVVLLAAPAAGKVAKRVVENINNSSSCHLTATGSDIVLVSSTIELI